MKDLMDIAYLTAQRPIDVVNIHSSHIYDGILHITQQKTGTKLRILLQGKLADIIYARLENITKGYLFQIDGDENYLAGHSLNALPS